MDFGPPIIGEDDDQHAVRIIGILHRHMEQFHRQHFKRILQESQLIGAGMAGLKVIQSFEIGDAVVLAKCDITRAFIHAATRKNTLSDQDLKGLIEAAIPPSPFSKAIEAAALPLAQKIRDILSEQGEYEHPVVKAAREAAGKPVTN
jgi:hypothetical protein